MYWVTAHGRFLRTAPVDTSFGACGTAYGIIGLEAIETICRYILEFEVLARTVRQGPSNLSWKGRGFLGYMRLLSAI